MINIEPYFSAICGRLDWEFSGFVQDITQDIEKQDVLNPKPVLGISLEMDIYHKLLMEDAFPSRLEMPAAASGDNRFWVFTLYLSCSKEVPGYLDIITSLAHQTRDYPLGIATRVLLGNASMILTKSKVLYQIRTFIPLNESFQV